MTAPMSNQGANQSQAQASPERSSQSMSNGSTMAARDKTMMASPMAKSPSATSQSGDHGPNDTEMVLDEYIVETCSLGDVRAYFPFDSTSIEKGKPRVKSLAECLTLGNLKGRDIVLTGHTDPRGTMHYNKELGKSRAEAVADVLVAAGIPRKQITIKSSGEKGDTANQSDWARERRVDLHIKY